VDPQHADDTTLRLETRTAEIQPEMARSLDRPGASRRIAPPAAPEEDLRLELDLAQKRIAELESELARQARVRTELVHLVAHELRTPITVISGFGRLLLAGDGEAALCDQQRHFVDESQKACRRLDRFVGDLLEAGSEGGTPLSIEIVEADLHATITAQLESLAPLLSERAMTVGLRLESTVARFAFDPRRIEQVVTNLMTNAIRYGRPKGVVRITTRLAREADGHEAAQVCVEDDGAGIPENDRERLFAPYVRGEGRTRSGGLGIGLAICRRIVNAHGGSIHVEAGELGGARFVFTLPTSRPGPVEH
jgi:signal transduction histidine kinase